MRCQRALSTRKTKALEVTENLTPVLKESQVKPTGVITQKGLGQLEITQSTTIQHGGGPRGRIERKHIPPNSKWFSVTQIEPCYKWCRQTEHSGESEAVPEEDGGDMGWVSTQHSTGAAGMTKALRPYPGKV
uniref:Uncharacterized protein n=1 Tax=Suricata suricatta TaxID=37032 RepID=A0A673V486_SURSU